MDALAQASAIMAILAQKGAVRQGSELVFLAVSIMARRPFLGFAETLAHVKMDVNTHGAVLDGYRRIE